MDTEKAMKLAIESAREGINLKEGGPFGACVVKGDKVISVAHNTVLKDQDPTCHAEMNAIRKAAKVLNTYDLSGCEIYSTVDPCPMCLTAIYWARLDKIIVAAGAELASQYGWDDEAFYQELVKTSELRKIPSEKGLLAKESEAVFKEWQSLGGKLY